MTTNLSGQWRINKSGILPIELAHSLKALRKVIGAVDTAKNDVAYARDDQSLFSGETHTIVIDPTFALKETPISPDNFDVLVGLAAHEGLHSTTHSDRVMERKFHNHSSPKDYELVNHIFAIGEEIYIDSYGRRNVPILGQYVTKSRQAYNLPAEQIPWNDIFNIWKAIAVYGHAIPNDLSDELMAQVAVVMDATTALTLRDLDVMQRTSIYNETIRKLIELTENQNLAGF